MHAPLKILRDILGLIISMYASKSTKIYKDFIAIIADISDILKK